MKSNQMKTQMKTQTPPPPQYRLFTISSSEQFALFSTDNRFENNASISQLLQNLPLLVGSYQGEEVPILQEAGFSP